ncbi:helix-turn-helix transcriptional regulator [Haloferax sp. DFSO52]|uniref:helix-turn-helix transcriptional regulator n=1 Tax=Haloferax sp. DFSO52 TaxID=3388505 RepID=UPI003A89B655
MVFERYDRLIETIECADRMSEFLIHAGGVCEDAPPEVLQQLTVTTAANNDPHAPINRYLTILGDEPVDRFRGVTPIVSRIFNEAAQQVIGPETEMELVVDQAVLERSRVNYPDAYELGKELDQFSMYVVDEDLEIGLVLVDGHGAVASHDDDGNIVALVDGDAPEVVTWVEGLYESLRTDATPVTYEESTR